MMLMMSTVNKQKEISFLLVSCWYQLASVSSFLPSVRLFFTLLIVVAAICSFIPWSRIMFPVSSAILWIFLTSISISLISCCSSSRILLRSSCLLPARICPESCCSFMWLISTVLSVLICLERQFFMYSSFFCSSSGWCELMKSRLTFLILSSSAESSSISTSDFCRSLQAMFDFSYSVRRGPRFLTFVSERISVLRRVSFSISALIAPPNFSTFIAFSPKLIAFFRAIQVGLFRRSCSRLSIKILQNMNQIWSECCRSSSMTWQRLSFGGGVWGGDRVGLVQQLLVNESLIYFIELICRQLSEKP